MQLIQINSSTINNEVKQCADALNVSLATWWAWSANGKTPRKHHITPRRVAWRSDEIDDLINRIAPREDSLHAS